jgi:AraC family transcriptional regulator
MILFVKNMLCDRCILIVRQQLENLGFTIGDITLGKVSITPEPSAEKLQQIMATFHTLGFELIDKEKDQLVEQVKTQVIELVHHADLAEAKESLTSTLAAKLNKEYTYLSRLFSDAEGITIEKYIIQQKVEKVKELLEYGELNLNEIAARMGYSSSAHLSTQFKSVTGMPPSKYKTQPTGNRKPLDQVS